MKLSNATLYRSMFGMAPDAETVEAALQAAAFVPIGASQEISLGWVPPRAAEGALIEIVGGQWIMRLMIESKSVPASAIRREVEKRTAQIEKDTGRKPGRKETKEIKEDVTHALLPLAFAKQSVVSVWYDPAAGTIVLDTASSTKGDVVATALVRAIPGLALALVQPAQTPGAMMAAWLRDGEGPVGFTIDRDCELRAMDESKSVVKYTNHALDVPEVVDHIARGFVPSWLALTWEDRVTFVLTEGMALRSLSFLDSGMDGASDVPADAFDADVAISTGESSALIRDLIVALGGESQMTIGQAEEQADAVDPAAKAIVRAAFEGLEESARNMTNGAAIITVESGGKTLLTFGDGPDPLIDQARALVIEHDKASISLVQRYLKIGYNRAAALVEALEKLGVVSACGPTGLRTVKAIA